MSRIVGEFLHRENFNAGDKDDGSIHAIFIWLSWNGGKFLGWSLLVLLVMWILYILEESKIYESHNFEILLWKIVDILNNNREE